MFTSIKEICSFIQDFIFLTKYNLKRLYHFNKKTITFCCSCNCKIKKKNSQSENFEIPTDLLVQTESFPNFIPSEFFFTKRKCKRNNIEPCNFRIKFKFIQKINSYQFIYTKNLYHNHKPQVETFKDVRLFFFLFLFIFFFFLKF